MHKNVLGSAMLLASVFSGTALAAQVVPSMTGDGFLSSVRMICDRDGNCERSSDNPVDGAVRGVLNGVEGRGNFRDDRDGDRRYRDRDRDRDRDRGYRRDYRRDNDD